MGKRFTDTEKWTKNKWFRKLSKDLKLFWLFILDNCDCVGVWEEDIEFVCEVAGIKISHDDAITSFSGQIQVIQNGKKWWITNFCFYQYGELKEENIKNKPHQKYISELKKHRLWIDYTKTIHSLKEKEEDKEKEKEEVQQIESEINENALAPMMLKIFKSKNAYYPAENIKDLTACLEIAYKIGVGLNITKSDVVGSKKDQVLSEWQKITSFVVSDNWYRNRSITDLSREWQRLMLAKSNKSNPVEQQAGNILAGRKILGQ